MQTMPGIIGGSGIIRIDTPKGASWTMVPTPWATPSGAIRAGRLSGLPAPWGHGRPRRRLDAACAHDLSVDAGAAVFHPGGKPGFTTAGGGDVFRMTGLSEPCRARDAGLCHAVVAMVTDCDCWHPGYGAVDVAQVIAVMAKKTGAAHGMVKHMAPRLAPNLAPCPHLCDRALRHAPINAPDRRGPTLPARLDAVAARVP